MLNFILSVFFIFVSVALVGALSIIFNLQKKVYKKKTSLSKLIYETMYYTGGILRQNKIKHYPIVDIRYYGTKKWAGKHCQEGRIVIYTKSNKDLSDLINTILHEISHHISMKTGCIEYIQYDKFLNDFGYLNHPEEIKARKFASQHIQPCLDYLISKGIIE